MLSLTNLELSRRRLPRLTHGEFYKALGGRIMMVCEPIRGSIDKYWDVGPVPGSVYIGSDFGSRLGMSQHRFQDIFSCLTFSGRHGTYAVGEVIFLLVNIQFIRLMHRESQDTWADILKQGEGHPRGIDREGVFRGGVSLTVKGHRIPYRGVSDGVKGHPIRCPRMPFRGVSVTPLMMGVITPRYFDF